MLGWTLASLAAVAWLVPFAFALEAARRRRYDR